MRFSGTRGARVAKRPYLRTKRYSEYSVPKVYRVTNIGREQILGTFKYDHSPLVSPSELFLPGA